MPWSWNPNYEYWSRVDLRIKWVLNVAAASGVYNHRIDVVGVQC